MATICAIMPPIDAPTTCAWRHCHTNRFYCVRSFFRERSVLAQLFPSTFDCFAPDSWHSQVFMRPPGELDVVQLRAELFLNRGSSSCWER